MADCEFDHGIALCNRVVDANWISKRDGSVTAFHPSLHDYFNHAPTPAGATHPAEVWEGLQRPQRRDRPNRGDVRCPYGL